MPIVFNGNQNISTVLFNGQPVRRIEYNGETVWEQ